MKTLFASAICVLIAIFCNFLPSSPGTSFNSPGLSHIRVAGNNFTTTTKASLISGAFSYNTAHAQTGLFNTFKRNIDEDDNKNKGENNRGKRNGQHEEGGGVKTENTENDPSAIDVRPTTTVPRSPRVLGATTTEGTSTVDAATTTNTERKEKNETTKTVQTSTTTNSTSTKDSELAVSATEESTPTPSATVREDVRGQDLTVGAGFIRRVLIEPGAIKTFYTNILKGPINTGYGGTIYEFDKFSPMQTKMFLVVALVLAGLGGILIYKGGAPVERNRERTIVYRDIISRRIKRKHYGN